MLVTFFKIYKKKKRQKRKKKTKIKKNDTETCHKGNLPSGFLFNTLFRKNS